MNIRKVSLPINVKLTVMVLFLTGLALLSYIYLAIDLFKSDKVAYVFDSVESQNNQVALLMEEQLTQVHRYHKLFHKVGARSLLMKQMLEQMPLISGYAEMRGEQNFKFYAQDLILEPSIFDVTFKGRFFIYQQKEVDYLVEFVKAGELRSVVLVELDNLKKQIPASSLYDFGIAIKDRVLSEKEFPLTSKKIKEIGFQTTRVGENIIAFRPLMEDITFFTYVTYRKALSAATKLTERSLYFGILVAGVVVLSILFFSGLITRPIKHLYGASLELSKGNFSHRVKIKGSDEIGVLGDSFNYMADEIKRYLEEMKEKARMENELQTAQLVQKSFFPESEIRGKRVQLDAYYKTSSECGGDWWGYLETEKSEIVIIIDVTGHGTPAALMTALMHNSLVSLDHLYKEDSAYGLDSSKIMAFLNKSFSSVDINLNATAFVAVFSGESITYTNASHNPPFLLRSKEVKYTRQDITPLNENNGKRLGEDLNSSYASHQIELKQKDQLVLFTDGILEATNVSGKEYGQRNFIKNLLEQLNKNQEITSQNTIENFNQFIIGKEPLDDITFLNMRYQKKKVYFFDTEISLAINEKLNQLNLELTESSIEADLIVYQDKISDCIKSTQIGTHLMGIISVESFLQKQGPLRSYDPSLQQELTINFKDESVSKVGEIIEKAIKRILIKDSFSEMERYIKQSALELVQNALIYKRQNNLEGDVKLTIGREESHYIVEVRDSFGALDPLLIFGKVARAYKEKTYEMKETGAGLGYSMIIIGSDEVLIRVKKGEFTQIRSIINKHKRMRDFKQKHNAIFVKKG